MSLEKDKNICSVCGEVVDVNDKFCSSCGSVINSKNITETVTKANDRQSAKVKTISEKKIKANTKETGEKNQVKKLSGTKLLYISFFLIFVLAVILYSSGVFDQPSEPSSSQEVSSFHGGVDLQNLQRINDLENELKQNPDQKKLLELAHLLNDSGFKEKAIEKYKDYLKNDSKNPDVLVDMGVCYYDLGKYEEAVKQMKEALKHKPDHQIAHLNLGVISIANGKNDEAVVWWKKTVAINPNSDIAKRAQELINSH